MLCVAFSSKETCGEKADGIEGSKPLNGGAYIVSLRHRVKHVHKPFVRHLKRSSGALLA